MFLYYFSIYILLAWMDNESLVYFIYVFTAYYQSSQTIDYVHLKIEFLRLTDAKYFCFIDTYCFFYKSLKSSFRSLTAFYFLCSFFVNFK